MIRHIKLPFTKEDTAQIKCGDILYLTGIVYTARDAAHKRMYDAVCAYFEERGAAGAEAVQREENDNGPKEPDIAGRLYEEGILPIDLKGTVLYYLGPTPARPGQVIGSAGPTTSGRMDKYTPMLLDLGLAGMIGKGRRSEEVRAAIAKDHAIYMGATGGAGALLSKCIKKAETVAYDDLGTEAIRKLFVEEFPVTVLIDAEGRVYDYNSKQ